VELSPTLISSVTDAVDEEVTAWQDKYPTISKMWRAKWTEIITLFDFPAPIRKAISTTNAIESVNSVIRKFTRNRKIYPNEESALKITFMAIREASKKWKMPIRNWKAALNHFAILLEGRLPMQSPSFQTLSPDTRNLTGPQKQMRTARGAPRLVGEDLDTAGEHLETRRLLLQVLQPLLQFRLAWPCGPNSLPIPVGRPPQRAFPDRSDLASGVVPPAVAQRQPLLRRGIILQLLDRHLLQLGIAAVGKQRQTFSPFVLLEAQSLASLQVGFGIGRTGLRSCCGMLCLCFAF